MRHSSCIQRLVIVFASMLPLAQSVTPVEKVVQLLTELREKVQKEGAQEAVSYDKFACFCKDKSDAKVYEIEKSDTKIDALNAAIEKLEGEIATLDSEVTDLKGEVETEQKEAEEALATRTEEHKTFQEKHDELTAAISATERAMEALKNSKSEVETAALLSKTQQALKKVSHVGVNMPTVLLMTERKLRATAPGDAPVYEYSSNEVIATLQGLTRTFKSELTRLDEEESSTQHDFAMVEGARANKVKAYEADITKKEQLSAEKTEEKSAAQKDLTEETNARNADQAFLDELTSMCESKATLWDQRSKARAGELTAMSQALEILKGMGEQYKVNTKLTGLIVKKSPQSTSARKVSVHKAPFFMQLKSLQNSKLTKLIAFLNSKGEALKSNSLLVLASQLSEGGVETNAAPAPAAASVDHFVKVRGLIKDLIARLEADAEAEQTQKTMCDQQMTASITSRDAKAAEMESLSASIDTTKVKIAELEKYIAELAERIAALNKSLNELIQMRAEEKAQNEKTIADADAGAEAITQAITIIKDFYNMELVQIKSSSLVVASAPAGAEYTPYSAPGADRTGQTVSDLAPETFEGEYKGKADENTGIVGLLEVIKSDFERTSSTTSAAETAAQTAYETQKSDYEAEISTKETLKQTQEDDLSTAETDLVGYEDDLKSATELHEEAIESLESLKAMCVDQAGSYEQTREEREKEIEALKQALAILEDWQS